MSIDFDIALMISLSFLIFPDPIPKNTPGIKNNSASITTIPLINGDLLIIEPVSGFLSIPPGKSPIPIMIQNTNKEIPAYKRPFFSLLVNLNEFSS